MIYQVHYMQYWVRLMFDYFVVIWKKYTGLDTDLIPDREYEAFPEFFTVFNTLHKSNKCIDTLSFNLQQQIW